MGFIDANARRSFAGDKLAKHNLFETAQMFCDVYCLEPGQAQKPHAHAGATKFYFVLDGRGTFSVGDATRELGPGELAWSEPGESHGVANTSNARLVLLVAMAPNPNASK
ncbi:MAG: cupin domain-containing protein [Planctomycetes bacterium]|nr:cupin domain-containing protein [Planctomycetota bacterium]